MGLKLEKIERKLTTWMLSGLPFWKAKNKRHSCKYLKKMRNRKLRRTPQDQIPDQDTYKGWQW